MGMSRLPISRLHGSPIRLSSRAITASPNAHFRWPDGRVAAGSRPPKPFGRAVESSGLREKWACAAAPYAEAAVIPCLRHFGHPRLGRTVTSPLPEAPGPMRTDPRCVVDFDRVSATGGSRSRCLHRSL